MIYLGWFYENEKPETQRGQFVGIWHVYFLRWIDERWPSKLYRLNHACKELTCDDEFVQRLTGNNEWKLWEEMKPGWYIYVSMVNNILADSKWSIINKMET